ncbi:TPA: TIR domain-containing protein [Legionella bozemanae]
MPANILIVNKEKLTTDLESRIIKGKEIESLALDNNYSLDDLWAKEDNWSSFNIELLKRSFSKEDIAENYEKSGFTGSIPISPSDALLRNNFKTYIMKKISNLEGVIEKLSLFDEKISSDETQIIIEKNSVFIVHGHDLGAKYQVARVIEKLKLKPIILDEQIDEGLTIIEKFEKHSSQAQLAVVLLTGDDIGYPKNDPTQKKPRARQNVIQELGFFMAKLGRKNVIGLYEDGVELPSDYSGVLYIKLESGWELKLAKELKGRGVRVNIDDLI